jgi:hypothetical protein
MKKIYLLLLALPLLMQSCLKDQEDFFSESSADRVDAFGKDVKSVLIGATNGWKMEMFPSSTQDFGGYTLFLKFTESSVTVSSELAEADKKETSLWTINKSSGIVLTFDTYNSLFHYFSGPNKDQGTVYRGLEGDMDFIVLEATPDKVKLKGTKSQNIIEMTPIQSGADWTALMTEYKKAAETFTFSLFEYQAKGQTFEVDTYSRTLFIYSPHEDGSTDEVAASYIFTLTGLKFYNPLVVDGDSIKEMTFKQDGTTKYFEDAAGSGARLVVIVPPLTTQLRNGNWYFAYSAIGPYGKQYWDYVKTNGLDPIEEELYYAFLGYDASGYYSFNFASTDYTYAYAGFLAYNLTVKSNTEINLTLLGYLTGTNGQWYYQNARFNYYTTALGPTTGTNYTLTSDKDEATWIKLTDNANPNNYYTLYKSIIYWPYDK